MRRYIFILIPLFFFGCNNTVPYEIRNNTDYDVTLYDAKNVNHTEYFIEAHTIVTIDHTKNAELELKNNTAPIRVDNNFIYTEVNELQSYNITIYNNSDKILTLKVLNTTHDSTAIFTIPVSFNDTIKIYSIKTPDIKLYYSSSEYNNYVIRDKNIIIY